jgi:hypothetical protein
VIRRVQGTLHERCEPFQVLDDGSEAELVACAGEAPQSHTLEAMMSLQVCEAHFYLLAFSLRLDERLCRGKCPGEVAGVFITSRGILRCGVLGAHFGFSTQP